MTQTLIFNKKKNPKQQAIDTKSGKGSTLIFNKKPPVKVNARRLV